MNKKNLQAIFKKYVDNFEVLNNEDNDETYKWEIAQEFQSFDVDAPEFAEMLAHMWKVSANLIDNSQQLPFYALVDYARREPETVREMFRNLFADEYLDCDAKQRTINEFINASEKLRMKYNPDSRLYINNQRSVMMYLFLRYPNSNYGYKASQAKSFADCIQFFDDWGPMTDFRLDVFGRMCDQLVEEIKANEVLVRTHRSRFEKTKRKLFSDDNYHILVLDIIYTSQTYNFYGDMKFDPINAQARKLHFERVAKAQTLAEAVAKAKADMELLAEANDYLARVLAKDSLVTHKVFGEGIVTAYGKLIVSAFFAKLNETKHLGLVTIIENGLLKLSNEEVTQKVVKYLPVLKKEQDLPKILAKATDELQPYLEYLD